jgi:tripartite-type tricarboxylate transporter receptor subunit TctC
VQLRLSALLAALACSAGVMAQGYPAKPIRLIVGYPPGGSGDFTTRLIADEVPSIEAAKWRRSALCS